MNKDKDPRFTKEVIIKLASPEEIIAWSHGEVIKPETLNYRTQRPEKNGLFSERIFGPTKDYECYCGKYKKYRYHGITCEKCGVQVTRTVVRREWMGHVVLAEPICHVWFLRTIPSKISLMLDISVPKLVKVVYYAAFIVTKVNEESKKRALLEIKREFKSLKIEQGVEAAKTAKEKSEEILAILKPGLILTEEEYYVLSDRFGDCFEADRGAGALRKILEQIDLEKMYKALHEELESVKDFNRERRILRRLRVVRAFLRAGVRPEWMILKVLPVLPPDLRPMVALDGGRYATADLNDLYRRVLNRNNRLKKLLELKAPEVIITNEKRMLQEAVDALIDNTSHTGSQVLSSRRRPLKSLADMLKGKQGRFRQNLLGKRVDYSARSVIVVGPELKINECGLPKMMALELFRPFVIQKIIEKKLAYNIKQANRLIEYAPPEVWGILEEVIANRLVLLNRAPTLHRLGIQAFRPLLIEDLAIRIPALVCAAFNADFDGDQMAVHLPLTLEAQYEARALMDASRNILKPANGEPIAEPAKDIVLGCYFLTYMNENDDSSKAQIKVFSDFVEVMFAYENGVIDICEKIRVPHPKLGVHNMQKSNGKFIETTYGRLIFNKILPSDFEFINEHLNKKALSRLVARIIETCGIAETYVYLDKIQKMGFAFSTMSGITWGMNDTMVPKEKPEILAEGEKEIEKTELEYDEGLLTDEERREKVITVWTAIREKIAKLIPKVLGRENPIFSIIDSGARGSWSQPIQMMGMKGLVINPKGEVIELPVKSSYKEGLTVLEYFIATHGARKGSTDTALKTSSAGYLTRRLVDVAQDIIVREEDCKTKQGIEIKKQEGDEYGAKFSNRLYSRTVLEDIYVGIKLFLKAGEIITKKQAEEMQDIGVETVKVRSPITCETFYGVCSKCYGLDLAKGSQIMTGEAVGIIAAQSIGEPGTQLTMRTFHIGGVAGVDITHGLPRVEEIFEARTPKGKAPLVKTDGVVEDIEEHGLIQIIKIKTKETKKSKKPSFDEYVVSPGVTFYVKKGDTVARGVQLCEGPLDIKEIAEYRSIEEAARYILKEVQKIYIPEGASINDKHIEVIVRQMLSRVMVKNPGDTDLTVGEITDKSRFLEMNSITKTKGGAPSKSTPLIMGITQVALTTESFLSAASFQETSRVLVNAAIEKKGDSLKGLKENVIIGKLIPAGTGWRKINEEELKKIKELLFNENL